MEQKVFVFHSSGAQFSGGVFSSKDKAEAWILKHKLSGMLTGYPLDNGAYDWAVESELFTPKKELHYSASFIGGFTSAHLEHYHYEDGINA
ncbi:DUF7710 domain-containing protein [Pleionea sediminis]|uniref:DUF7710 domain-containing protein n=1 Tax=Pleionea sediminis TaxID=2569479 RepID=UPI001184C68F|nr:hypothetical protein [Pleionea sediminis]